MINVNYRYIVVYDNLNNIIYGECIKWKIGDFDLDLEYQGSPIKLSSELFYKSMSSNLPLHEIDEELRQIKIGDLKLKFMIDENDFIKKCYDAPFNPLIDRCSRVSIFASEEELALESQRWLKKQKKALQILKDVTQIDLLKHVELFQTFIIYEPIRINVESRYLDKVDGPQVLEPKKLEVTFQDEFQEFGNSQCKVSAFKNKEIVGYKESAISNVIQLDMNESPDELEIIIRDEEDKLIYYQRYFYIKEVSIQSTLFTDSIELEDGNIVEKYTSNNFRIGK